MKRDDLIDVAHRIGRRIADTALWDGDACTWEVATYDPPSGRSRYEVTGGNLYQGTAGIAFFLGELFRLVPDTEIARAATGALRHALDCAAALPPASFAFHGGRVGTAWVTVRLSGILARPELSDEAQALLAPAVGLEAEDHAFDVIGGAGGAIPALLQLRHDLDRPDLGEMAVRLGERLIDAARREPGGWSWKTVGNSATRNLAGLGHGASGIGLALLELAHATGDGRFRFAAEMAFLYERQLFDAERSNWPDLRHKALSDLIYSGDPDAVRRAAAAANIPPFEPHFMTAWCHGAAGIGLARVRAYALSGKVLYRQEAEAALRSTLPGLYPPVRGNFSLCHGAGGNAELPLYASRVFGDPVLREVCEACAEHGFETFEKAGKPWPCGTADLATDPSLLLGEAGIGHFYLRLADEQTASILLHEPSVSVGVVEDDGFAEQAARWVDESFGATRRIFAALGAVPPAISPSGPEPLQAAPVETAYHDLCRLVETAPDDRRELLADAFRVERARFELSATPNDLTMAFLRRLRRPPVETMDWRAESFVLADEVRPVATHWDWSSWLQSREAGAPANGGPSEAETQWLIARQGDRLVCRPVGALTALLVDSLVSPFRLADLVDHVAAGLGNGASIDRSILTERIVEQLRELYRVDFLDLESAVVTNEVWRNARPTAPLNV